MNAEMKGLELGWDDALAYVTGGKQQRAAIRRRLAKAAAGAGGFWARYRDAFRDRAEQRAEAIEAGRAARTIGPRKLRYILQYVI